MRNVTARISGFGINNIVTESLIFLRTNQSDLYQPVLVTEELNKVLPLALALNLLLSFDNVCTDNAARNVPQN